MAENKTKRGVESYRRKDKRRQTPMRKAEHEGIAPQLRNFVRQTEQAPPCCRLMYTGQYVHV
jgi:hypothetical protein